MNFMIPRGIPELSCDVFVRQGRSIAFHVLRAAQSATEKELSALRPKGVSVLDQALKGEL
jgi:hypothetical protein